MSVSASPAAVWRGTRRTDGRQNRIRQQAARAHDPADQDRATSAIQNGGKAQLEWRTPAIAALGTCGFGRKRHGAATAVRRLATTDFSRAQPRATLPAGVEEHGEQGQRALMMMRAPGVEAEQRDDVEVSVKRALRGWRDERAPSA